MSRCVTLMKFFSEVIDPRDSWWVFHELTDILAMAVLAVIVGAEGWEEIKEFGKQEWLKKFLRLSNGVPSHDTISRDQAAGVSGRFTQWIESLHEDLGLKLVAIDGKTLRRSYDKQTRKSALHSVCAWSVENHVTLGQQACEENSVCRRRQTQEKGHGRVEQRDYYQTPLPEKLRPFARQHQEKTKTSRLE